MSVSQEERIRLSLEAARAFQEKLPGAKFYPAIYKPDTKQHVGVATFDKCLTSDLKKLEGLLIRYRDSYLCAPAKENGVVIVDIDDKPGETEKGSDSLLDLELEHGLVLPETARSKTPSGTGEHLLYLGEVKAKAHSIAHRVDTAFMTPLPGVYAPGKGYYGPLNGTPFAPIPQWVIDRVGRPLERDAGVDNPACELDHQANVALAKDYLINHAPEAIEGQGGDNTAVDVALAVRDLGITEAMCLDLMLEHYESKCHPFDAAWLTQKVEHAYQYAKRQIGAESPLAEFEPVPLKEETEAKPTGEPTADLVPVEYVINGFLSCGVLYLGGGHGVGKSTFLAPITALVTGELPKQFDGLCVTLNRRVIYFAEDPDQMKRCRHALVKYHGMTENRDVFHIRRAERRTPAQVATLLKALMAEHTITGPNGYQIKPLVIFDTTNANFEIENENDSQMVGKFIASMKENAPGAPVWVIGHVAKALLRADLEELTGRGSGAWEADAQQTAFIFADEKVDKDARFLGVKKCRFEPEYREVKLKTETAREIISTPWDEDQTIVLRHGMPTRCSKAERERAKEEAKIEKAAAAVNDASQVIRNILNGCAAPVSRNRVLTEAQAMGLKQKTAREAVDLLIEDGEARDDGAYMAGNVQRRDGVYLVNGERF